ncbi:unnamed protein product [Mytilus coruscus]|uniref:Endonuclease/exonuclease/phosphatase domain-containing protein n=1 Tax=Mytilus coruscus TaxID=42192 RepID=A0A6J8E675_MYTCO|nr:unnamed protein product [Mytilus coruscus]
MATGTDLNTVSTEEKPSSTRKRSNSGTESNTESAESKKLKTVNLETQTVLPKMGKSETFLLSAIQNLANNISVSFNIMNSRMNQLEANLEEKRSANIVTALKTHIEKEVGKVKQELKDDMVTTNLKIRNVQKSCENLILEKTDENSINIRNNVIIRNLPYDEREKDNAEVTLNKRPERMETERYNGVVVVQFEDNEQKKDTFKNKRNLKNNPAYKKVYIDNDLPVETRMFQGNVRTCSKKSEKKMRSQKPIIDGYTWIGNNRENLHINAQRGSGGVGAFLKNDLFEFYDITTLDNSVEEISWIKLKSKSSDFILCVAVCYLPPNESSRLNDQELFFENLLHQVYCYQSIGNIVICGDFDSRTGNKSDYIEGVDEISPRSVIDVNENYNGDLFIDFLTNINFAMLNGKIGLNDFTYISPQGKSVVDYMCVPREQFNEFLDFKVLKMIDILVINQVNYSPEKVPDHSILLCEIRVPKVCIERNTHTIDETTSNSRKYRMNNIPDNFLLDNAIRDRNNETINRIENAINVENNVQSAFDEFCVLLKDEMDNKLPKMKPKHDSNGYGKSRYKPYLNDYLQNQWKKVCSLEKLWLKCTGPIRQKKSLKANYCSERKTFDRLNRKYKRKHLLEKQGRLEEKLMASNQRDFWKSIGKLGMSNERNQSIPWSIIGDDGIVKTDKNVVLGKWKSDFEQLFSVNPNVRPPAYDNETRVKSPRCHRAERTNFTRRNSCCSRTSKAS